MKTPEELKQWMIDQRPNGIDAIKAIQADAIQGTIPAEELRKVVELLRPILSYGQPGLANRAEEAVKILTSLIHRADSPKGPA